MDIRPADAVSSTREQRAKTAADENFPVGSWLIARELRPLVHAFYRFARAADDIADNPGLDVAEKESRLQRLDAILAGAPASDDPAEVKAGVLRELFIVRELSLDHPRQLLQAFIADARNRPCRGWSDLLAYCRYSAAPVGRFLLDLHGESRSTWPASDALCAGLQIINHLQDCQADWRRLRRLYLPQDWFASAGLEPDVLLHRRTSPALRHVLDRTLDGVDRLVAAARPLPRVIANRRLRLEAAVIVDIARRLARKLRRRDPLAEHVRLSAPAQAAALVYGIAAGWRA